MERLGGALEMQNKNKKNKHEITYAVITKIPEWDGIDRDWNDEDFDYFNSDGNAYDDFIVGLPCDPDEDMCDEINGKPFRFVDSDLLTHKRTIEIIEESRKEDSDVMYLNVKLKVFELGEILILDSYGREFGGAGRKPSKWFVEYKMFDEIDKAIDCALKIAEGKGC